MAPKAVRERSYPQKSVQRVNVLRTELSEPLVQHAASARTVAVARRDRPASAGPVRWFGLVWFGLERDRSPATLTAFFRAASRRH